MDDSVIMCDEVLESYDKETKAIRRNLKKKKANFYILIAFLLITKALLIAVSIWLLSDRVTSKKKTFITVSRHK